jgi:hypothetical protein
VLLLLYRHRIDRIIVLRATEASAMTFEIFSSHISLSLFTA